MALSRTWYDTLIDDNGSNTVGTLWNKAAVDHVYDDVDAELARLDGRVDIVKVDVVQTTRTDFGAQNNWPIGLTAQHTITRWAGSADLFVTGVAGGVAGVRWTFRNLGTFVAYFTHNSGASTIGNRLTNAATSGTTPVAPGGWATYQHDGTAWILITHEQGAWVTPTYSAGNFTSNVGSWTVEAGDINAYAFRLSGRTLTVSWYLQTTSVTGTPTQLRIAIPGGFTAGKASLHPLVHDDAGAGNAGSFCLLTGTGATTIDNFKAYGGGAFANATNTTRLFATITIEIN
jgi:hypothetical protein